MVIGMADRITMVIIMEVIRIIEDMEEVFMGIGNMSIVSDLLATFGLLLLVRQMNGPWGIIARWRNALMRIPIIGKQFYDALECPYCSGCYCAVVIYCFSFYCGKLGSAFCFVLA